MASAEQPPDYEDAISALREPSATELEQLVLKVSSTLQLNGKFMSQSRRERVRQDVVSCRNSIHATDLAPQNRLAPITVLHNLSMATVHILENVCDHVYADTTSDPLGMLWRQAHWLIRRVVLTCWRDVDIDHAIPAAIEVRLRFIVIGMFIDLASARSFVDVSRCYRKAQTLAAGMAWKCEGEGRSLLTEDFGPVKWEAIDGHDLQNLHDQVLTLVQSNLHKVEESVGNDIVAALNESAGWMVQFDAVGALVRPEIAEKGLLWTTAMVAWAVEYEKAKPKPVALSLARDGGELPPGYICEPPRNRGRSTTNNEIAAEVTSAIPQVPLRRLYDLPIAGRSQGTTSSIVQAGAGQLQQEPYSRRVAPSPLPAWVRALQSPAAARLPSEHSPDSDDTSTVTPGTEPRTSSHSAQAAASPSRENNGDQDEVTATSVSGSADSPSPLPGLLYALFFAIFISVTWLGTDY